MRIAPLPGSGLRPSVISLGTGSFGSGIPRDDSFRILDAYAEAGGNFLDTAHCYAAWLPNGAGASERTLGAWLKTRNTREKIMVATKGAHPDLQQMQVSRMRPEHIAQDLRESLERLQLDRVDLYWLHRDDPGVPVGEVLSALNEHLAAGRIGALGASNWSSGRLDAASSYASAHGLTGFCASQIGWSFARVNPGISGQNGMVFMDDETLVWHRKTHLPVAAYSSQANGFFSGKYRRGEMPENKKGLAKTYFNDSNFGCLERAQALARKLGRTANDIALAYLTSQAFPAYAIVGPHSVEQVKSSCAAGNLELAPEDLQFLETAAPV